MKARSAQSNPSCFPCQSRDLKCLIKGTVKILLQFSDLFPFLVWPNTCHPLNVGLLCLPAPHKLSAFARFTWLWSSVFPQIWIYGNSFESFLVAVVNPNKEALEKWARENGVSGDFNSLCENPRAKEFIIGELSKTGKEKKVPSCIAYAENFFFLPFGHLSNT